MESQPKYLAEIKALIDVYGIDTLAELIDMSKRGIEYWFGPSPKKPGPATQRTIHELFIRHSAGEDLRESVRPEFNVLLIRSQQREIKRLQDDLDLSLNELRRNIVVSLALAETNQNLLIELVAKQRKISVDILYEEVGKENGERALRIKEDGNFPYVDI